MNCAGCIIFRHFSTVNIDTTYSINRRVYECGGTAQMEDQLQSFAQINPCIVQGSTVKLNVCELSHLTCCSSVAWVPRTFISHVLFMCYFNFNRILHFISYHLPISNKFILGLRSCISFVSFSPFQGIIWIPKLYTSEACSF